MDRYEVTVRHVFVMHLAMAAAVAGPFASQALAEGPNEGGKEPSKVEAIDKSSKIAFAMSLILPGLGELYYGAEKRGAAFLAVEVGTWITYAHWSNNGQSIERDFRSFADRHWDESRFRDWDNDPLSANYVRAETLPSKQEDIQQYYELIGKYNQFVFGWDDGKDPEGRVGQEIPYDVDPGQVLSANRLNYETERNRSNRYFKRSSRILGLVVFNHVVSAIDASIHARGLGARLWVDTALIGGGGADPVPAFRVNLGF